MRYTSQCEKPEQALIENLDLIENLELSDDPCPYPKGHCRTWGCDNSCTAKDREKYWI